MKNYEKPIVVVDSEIAEGVYAASGSDCWSVSVNSVQAWDGSYHVFEVTAVHSTAVEHISSNLSITFKVSGGVVTYARSEFPCSGSGDTVSVSRSLLANAYKSGDNVTFKVWVGSSDQATTQALSMRVDSVSCTHETNVQGKLD